MSKKSIDGSWYLLFFVIIVVAIVGVFLHLESEGMLTGFFVSVSEENIWDFVDADKYTYDDSVINFSEGEIKLVSTISQDSWTEEDVSVLGIIQATLHNSGEDSHDKTTEIQTNDGNFVNLQKSNAVLDVTFPTALENGDAISLYLLQGNNVNTDVYLCDEGVVCEAPGYGLVRFEETEGWYNITISGLNNAVDTLGIDPPNRIKIDYVEAYHTEVTEHNSTNVTYPTFGTIITEDFEPVDLESWDDFIVVEQLNDQQILYEYSIDSGNSWLSMPEDDDLSSVESNKIRIKALLESDGTASPVIQEMQIRYTAVVPCNENWEINYGVCEIDDLKQKYYVDGNLCETTNNLPDDNGTDVACDYCLPEWIELNDTCNLNDVITATFVDNNGCYDVTGLDSDNNIPEEIEYPCDYCLPEWIELNDTCNLNDVITATFVDNNGCYDVTGLDSDNNIPEEIEYPCDYCASHNCSGSAELEPDYQTEENRSFWKIDNRNETNITLEIDTEEVVNVSILLFSHNIKEETPSANSLNKYLEINSTAENISSAKIIVYYTDEELEAAGIDEQTLKIYYYNTTSDTANPWEELDSIVNETGNYVHTTVDHFSLYGVFGLEQTDNQNPGSESNSNSGGGGGSGGGGSSGGSSLRSESSDGEISKKTSEDTIVSKTSADTLRETKESNIITRKEECNYNIKFDLPETISFISADTLGGKIINQGNCDISSLSVNLSPELAELISITPTAVDIKQGSNKKILILKKKEKKKGFWSRLTGAATTEIEEPVNFFGNVELIGITAGNIVFKKEFPINLVILKPKDITFSWFALGGLIFIVVMVITFIKHGSRKRKYKKERKKKIFYSYKKL